MGEEVERRNSELEREVTGLRNSYWTERKARLAAEAQALAWQRRSEQFEEQERLALVRNDDLFVAAKAVLDAERRLDVQAMDKAMAKLAATLSAPAEESNLQKMQSARAEESGDDPVVPALLEALKGMVDAYWRGSEDSDDEHAPAAVKAALAAIARAEVNG